MHKISSVLYDEILKYLTLFEIFREIVLISKEWQHQIYQLHFLQYIVQRDYNLSFKPFINLDKCMQCLQYLFKSPKHLKFLGYSTNGGIFDSMIEFSHLGLFIDDKSVYCTKEDRVNVDVSSVFYHALIDENDKSSQNEAERNTCCDNMSTTQVRDLCNSFENLYSCSWTQNFTGNLNQLKNCLKIKTEDIIRFPYNIKHSERTETFAAINGFWLSRKGELACPVSTLMIFTSENYIDITSPQFKMYNYLKTYNSIKKSAESCTTLAKIAQFKIKRSCEYVEFLPIITSGLRPIIWFKFKADTCKVILHNTFTGKYLYIKLICADDKREYYGIENSRKPNIECGNIFAYGHTIKFSL